jgi:hypothetical protein
MGDAPLAAKQRKLSSMHIVGYRECNYCTRAKQAAEMLLHNGLVSKVDAKIFDTPLEFRAWLAANGASFGAESQKHLTSPFCWTEDADFLGGCTEVETLVAELLNINTDGANQTYVSTSDGEASLARFHELVKSKEFTIWVFWRG